MDGRNVGTSVLVGNGVFTSIGVAVFLFAAGSVPFSVTVASANDEISVGEAFEAKKPCESRDQKIVIESRAASIINEKSEKIAQ